MSFAKLGAVCFGLWGLLHIAGGGYILSAALLSGPGAGYTIYGHDGSALPGQAGAVLAYFAYLLILAGVASLAIAATLNRTNSQTGLAINTGLIAAVELGLILFLIIPGYLSVPDALPGFVLFALAALFGGIACNRSPSHA
ncbi:hypothetical protein [Roseibium sp. M-1]